MRLDFDLDGVANIGPADRRGAPIDHRRRTTRSRTPSRPRRTTLKTEKQARAHLNLGDGPDLEDRQSERARTHVGEPVGYKFLPGDNSFPFASPNAWWRKRAGFVDHHVWVTPLPRGRTLRAPATIPTRATGGDGLTRWTEQDRPIENTDVVFWYTFGHTHIPRPEDYPVMPTAYIGFMLKPNGFFSENPANDVPPSQPGIRTESGSPCCHS